MQGVAVPRKRLPRVSFAWPVRRAIVSRSTESGFRLRSPLALAFFLRRATRACSLLLCGGVALCALRAQTIPVPTVGDTAADFSLSVTPPPALVQRGESVTLTVIVGSLGGFDGPVVLSTTGTLPAGIAASFSPSTVTPIAPKTTWAATISSALTINTGTVVSVTSRLAPQDPARLAGSALAVIPGLLGLGMLGWRKRGMRPLLAVAVLALLPFAGGCGLGILPPRSAGGTYTINLLATASTGQQHVVPLLVRVSE